MLKLNKRQSGFTIVELLVVIVVIAILVAITIVSYTGISNRAIASFMQSDLNNNAKLLKLYYAEYGSYPTTMLNNCPTAPNDDSKYCLKASEGNSIELKTPLSGSTFTLYAIKGTTQGYYITDSSPPSAGGKNLLSDDNSSFESSIGDWFFSVAGEGVSSTDWAIDEFYSLRSSIASSSTHPYLNITSITSAGGQYTASATIYAQNGESYLFFWDNVSGQTIGTSVSSGTTGISKVTKTFSPTSTSRRLFIGVPWPYKPVYTDAVKLEIGSVASPL